MSFGQYAIDVETGERLAFSVTIVLITVTQSIVTAGYLPICNEMLWLNFFNLISMIFTFFGIIETLLVLWILAIAKKSFDDVKDKDELDGLVLHDEKVDPDEEVNEGNKDLDETFEDIGKLSEKMEERKGMSKNKFVLLCTTRPQGPYDLVRRLDLLCLIILPVLYILFVLIMFGTNSSWEDKVEW